MRQIARRWFRLAILLVAMGLVLSDGERAQAQGAREQLDARLLRLEAELDARIGVQILDTGSGWRWGHRQDERFLMASTFKALLCGAVLQAVDRDKVSLNEKLPIGAEDIASHAPVTERYIGGQLSIAQLCHATLDQSDNTAANLLIDRLGGPQAVTQFLRSIGDEVTRLDRKEPELNQFVPGDPRDTTSPAAVVGSWQAMLLGDALSEIGKAQLRDWLSTGGVTGKLLRPSVPSGWQVADRSGGGRTHTRNIVAMLTPPERAPIFVAIFVSDTPANWSRRNAAVVEIGAAVMALIQGH
ncbi:class A beta-lactamase [Xinfangfangia sp. CPCC 101601]|uniref:Beta-lactamase n=1 Tax=Pseudogemmobacter lacusdianii TaxID=3069608 RepID=A0ABU0VTN8_9RHOB|nr:class A beta-lactamase [Xinfangfangia sp. CPCC 101601]MDQ2065097.1 class A beta-lactamase [Xinfangfangia sp. CPCC 101601]